MTNDSNLNTTSPQAGVGSLDDKQLFSFVEYRADAAEETAYSEYSYWKSVWQNFLKRRTAVFMSCVFILLFLFTFIAGPIGNYRYSEIRPDKSKIFIHPNGEYWFGTDNLGRDYWCQVWYATQISIKLSILVAVGEITLWRRDWPCLGLYAQVLTAFYRDLPYSRQCSNHNLSDAGCLDDWPKFLYLDRYTDPIRLDTACTACTQSGVDVPG